MKLSEMRRVLAANGIQLTKSLGQHFLHDPNQLQRIVAAADLNPTDAVLEIGPGLGPLTDLLLAGAERVLAIEKDQRLVEHLQKRLAHVPNLELLQADAVDYLREHPRNWSDWQLVANLPYSVTTPILTALVEADTCPRRLTVTVQWEVAQRLRAAAGAPDYGVLTLLVQLRYAPRGWFKIPRPCFFPEPDVDSACVTLERRTRPLLPPPLLERFGRLVRLSFSQRRKMLVKLLKTEWPLPTLEAAFARCGLPPQIRAEAVTLEQFVQLTQLLAAA